MRMLGQLLASALVLARNASAKLGDALVDDDRQPPRSQECQPLDGLHQHQPQVHSAVLFSA